MPRTEQKTAGSVSPVWARKTFISMATAASDIRLLNGLLDGSRSVPELTIDTSLQWSILETLAAQGQVKEAVILAHRASDGTDIGMRKALTCLSSTPTAAANAGAWEKLTTGGGSLQDKLAVAAGFVRFDQKQLLSPYLPRYVELVPSLWKNGTPEEARTLTSALYPLPLVSPSTVRVVSALLNTPLPESARKILLDSMDATSRALRAREVGAVEKPQ